MSRRTSPELMLATAADDSVIDGSLVRDTDAWWFERKHDGYRVAAIAVDGQVVLRTRNGIDATKAYPEIVAAFEDQPYRDYVVDGEVVVVDAVGTTSFELLQREAPLTQAPKPRKPGIEVRFVAFDLLTLDGVDLRSIELHRRRALLADAFEFDGVVVLSEILDGDQPRSLLEQACADGWEGLIAKRSDSAYRPGRSRNWYKLKCVLTDEMIIAGFTPPKGSRSGFGALILGTHQSGRLRHTGRVGTGFDDELLRSLRRTLDEMAIDRCPFEVEPAGLGAVTWVRPELVCEVGYTEWTDSGQLRHPRFRGLRPDKLAADITKEPIVALVEISNGDKIFYPATTAEPEPVTKAEVVEYYTRIAERMLPHIAERPLVLERFPNGITGTSFYQKNTPDHMPDYIGRLPVASESRGSITYPVVHDIAGLRYLANQAALVMHTLLSSAERPGTPIEIIWDLDPAGDDIGRVQRTAARLRSMLEELGLAPRVKTSGSKGLHVHVDVIDEPGTVSFEMSRAFAHRVANDVAMAFPDDVTLEFAKKDRKGRLFLDVLRNGHASHAAAPYSLRAVAEAALAAPLSWEEALAADFHPRMVTIRSIDERLDAGIDAWHDHPAPESTITAAARTLLA